MFNIQISQITNEAVYFAGSSSFLYPALVLLMTSAVGFLVFFILHTLTGKK